ncbi:cytochrome P450 family protein [Jatrophihabitans fulvus]
MTATDPTPTTGGTCPVIHFEYAPTVHPGEDYFDQLQRARRTGPVFRSDEAQGYWVLAKSEYIVEALQQPDVFSSSATIPIFPNPDYKWIPIMIDPPVHTKWRKLLGSWFSPGRTASLEEPVRDLSIGLIGDIVAKGSCDFVAEFAAKFPTAIFLRIIGLPVDRLPEFLEWEEHIVHFSPEKDPDASKMGTAMAEVTAMFRELIEQRRADPSRRADDIISAAIDWKIDGETIGDDDLISCLLLLFMAGLDTVTSQLSYIFRHLATHDADRQAIVDDPGRIPNAVEELLRYYSIVRVGRKVTLTSISTGVR